jgi:23S rRNA (uridine2479-2'-O)-methyltransferase
VPSSGRRPRVVRVRSETNDVQYADTLRRRRDKRLRQRELFVEGVRPINLALRHGWPVRAFLYSRDGRLSGWAEDVLAASSAEVHYELPRALLARLSGKTDASELIALVGMPEDDLGRIPMPDDALVVVFDRPASPGNLGSIIRSCDALGAHGLIVTGHAVDLYDPETISASTGSLFAVPCVRLASAAALRPWMAAARERLGRLRVVGSDEKGAVALDSHDLRGPTMLVVGNETWGMSAAYRELCDVVVRIPIGGAASSLNVASAAAILLWEAARQRRVGRRGVGL